MSSFGARAPHPGAPHVSRDLGRTSDGADRPLFAPDKHVGASPEAPWSSKPAAGWFYMILLPHSGA